MTYGAITPLPATTWPSPQSTDAVLAYSWDVSSDLGSVTVSSVSISAAPSGAGELTISNLSMTGSVVTAFISGGVAGRQYVVKIDVSYGGASVYSKLIGLTVAPILANWDTMPDPPSAGFGTPLVWTGGTITTTAALGGVATGLTGAGSSAATATLLSATVNVASGGVAGGGFVLNGTILSGSISLTNGWSGGDQLVWPPSGAQIDSYGVNVPIAVAPGDTVTFSTNAPTSQWYRT